MKKLLMNVPVVFALSSLFFFSQCNDREIPITPVDTEFTTSFTSASEYLKSLAPSSQSFTEDASNFISVISTNGFIYTFYNGSLMQNGIPVAGDVQIEVTEYVSKADMIFSGVTTLAGDRLLASGGMFDIEITANGSPVDLNGIYEVSIPRTQIDFGMQIFEGEEITNGDGTPGVNWVSADSSWIRQDSSETQDSGRYSLNLNFLSWCNLDKFYNATDGGQVRLQLPAECTSSNTTVYMLFDENSVVNLFADADLKEFNSGNYILPEGWDIKLLAVCVDDNNELSYALVDSEITDPHLETVTTMTKITEADLESLIKSL